MARDTDVDGHPLAGFWRAPLAGGRSLDSWLDERTERLLGAIAHRPVRLAIILLILNRAIGGALYSLFEADSDWFDGAWWVLVTQTTVGYGDFAPETFWGRATAELVMWTGKQAVAILTGALAGVIAERRIADAKEAAHLETATLEDDFDHLIKRLETDTQYLSDHLRRLKHITNDPRVVQALREANLPKEEGT
jgi:hypothetical protein